VARKARKIAQGQLKQSRRQNTWPAISVILLGAFLLDVEAAQDVTGRNRVSGGAGQARQTVCVATRKTDLSGFSSLKGELKLGPKEMLYDRAEAVS
jgi:hypothetical protein